MVYKQSDDQTFKQNNLPLECNQYTQFSDCATVSLQREFDGLITERLLSVSVRLLTPSPHGKLMKMWYLR